jgi:predicted nucleotidyltransferase
MTLSENQKDELKRDLVECLKREPEVRKIVVFGSFLQSESPNDVDVAVFQDSSESYLPLALKYRRNVRSITSRIPIDIIPVKAGAGTGIFLSVIESGEIIYEG